MDSENFTQLVAEAIEMLPEDFRDKMQNVEVVVEDWPDAETAATGAASRHPGGFAGFLSRRAPHPAHSGLQSGGPGQDQHLSGTYRVVVPHPGTGQGQSPPGGPA